MVRNQSFIAIEGLFEPDGILLTLWRLDLVAVEEGFRQRVIRELRKAQRLSDDFAGNLLIWEHSGFSVQAGRQAAPGETSRVEEMGRYLARPPMPQDLPELLPDGRVLVPTPPDPRTGATELVLDPLELLHRIVIQIPAPGQHMVRYYGAYSCRGRRAHARMDEAASEVWPPEQNRPAEVRGGTTDGDPDPEVDVSAYVRARRRSWARLIRHVFEVDPLECPACGGVMTVIAVITDPPIVDRIIRHLEQRAERDGDPQGPDPPPDGPRFAA